MDTVLEQMLRKYMTLLESELSSSNYKDRFALLLSCEEHQMQLDIRNYDMEVRLFKIEISLLKMYFWAALSSPLNQLQFQSTHPPKISPSFIF